jgi:hypothetical protein
MQHPNMLIQGTPAEIQERLWALRSGFYPAQYVWPETGRGSTDAAKTVIVSEVGDQTPEGLRALGNLILETNVPTQIVATSSDALYSRVRQGAFPADLYYRLNIVTVGRPPSEVSTSARPSLDDLIRRVRGEYLEMPGLALTAAQAGRLWGMDRGTCHRVLRALQERQFLTRHSNGRYGLSAS